MDKTLKMLMAGGAFALMAGYANAAMVATTASDISVRSGPGEDYPELGLATRGSSAVLDGCMDGSSWCRIEVNGLRGWAHADYLNVMYEGSPVILEDRRTELSVPVVTYEKTSSVQAEPNPGDPNLGRVGDVDITPPEAVITYMDEHPGDTVTFDGDVVVGTTLPSDTRLVEVPDYQYRYVRVNDVPVLVEPSTHRIVYVYQ
ncbi:MULTISPECIES: DUF1236 domain-containing protein [Rhizobium/Agrobacterium group]|uniref:DUF1236 domain-containing protein n=2 Tax=Rhizobium/Agrobacterium group TaxID=227290 RepID=A0AA88EZ91_RHIRH|nr:MULTISPECIES: DUF1236 domain-containing protein [Rhizobium/Agrobacterium group]KAA3500767.1 DUF1236 domain-containing protein [Rhizobium rhizogenes]MBO0130864.1 DUF1236 domain-containing protein [Agrobacterium burrii]MQB10597.1 DUF1236 domain-containing protein [Agrobacterium sp. ICMP 6402]NTZ90643.1 DUF1236 domain-containing protein [Agrobacterium tumefaciens]